ncbi:MAG: family metallopeptidase [Sphingobacteriaceae bacterium]|jgi:predicted Zn-dependent protease|nr:family metallopeptidase [Sphingobacteriaceae bacterium]
MKKIQFFSAGLIALIITSCSTVPLTGRKQLSLIDEAAIQQEAAQAYREFLNDPKTHVVNGTADANRVKRVGANIAAAISRYMQQNGYGDKYNYNWEFNLIQDKSINAWCMPGGKVAVYSGILPVAVNDAGLATVMGHEIAHAIAGHASERASQGAGAQILGGVLTGGSNSTLGQLYGLGGGLALLKFSRTQESEADRLGLIFMAMAGYDPNTAVSFWQRMSQASQGGAPPEFLSTHPSDATRIADIQKRLPEAMKYYKK